MPHRGSQGVLLRPPVTGPSASASRKTTRAVEEQRLGDGWEGVVSFTEYGPAQVPRDGFRTDDGRVVIEPVYSTAWAFSEERAAVRDSSGRWGFVSIEGVEVIPTQYEAVRDFTEGLAAAKRQGKWGFIDREGQVVIPFRYSWAR